MGQKVRIKILDTFFDSERNNIYWRIRKLDDGQSIILCYKKENILKAVFNRDGALTDDQVHYLNGIMRGKELWWIYSVDVEEFKVNEASIVERLKQLGEYPEI